MSRLRKVGFDAAWSYASRLSPVELQHQPIVEAIQRFNRRDVNGARYLLDEYLREHTSCVAGHITLASFQRKCLSINEALECLNHGLAALPSGHTAATRLLHLRTILDGEKGNIGAAEASLKLLERRCASIHDTIGLALTASAIQDSPSRLRETRHLEGVGDASLHSELARKLFSSTFFRQESRRKLVLHEVVQVCERGISLQPTRAALWDIHSQALCRLGDGDGARQMLRGADSMKFLGPKALYRWAELEVKAGNLDKARLLFSRISHREDAVIRLCELDLAENHRAEALQRIQQYIEMCPWSSAAYLTWARLEMHPDRAHHVLRMALKHCNRAQAPLYNAIASIERKSGRIPAARQALASALRAQPDHIPSAHQLALLELESGRLLSAERYVDAALKFEPNNVQLLQVKRQLSERGIDDGDGDGPQSSREFELNALKQAYAANTSSSFAVRNLMNAVKRTRVGREKAIRIGLVYLHGPGKLSLTGSLFVGNSTAYALSSLNGKHITDALELLDDIIARVENADAMYNEKLTIALQSAKLAFARIASRRGLDSSWYLKAFAHLEGFETWIRHQDIRDARRALVNLKRWCPMVKLHPEQNQTLSAAQSC